MLKILGLSIVGLIAAVLLYAATRPDTFEVHRTATIQAPPEKIFPLIDDFHNWSAWSPWEKLDPAMKRTHGGAPSGPGATYAWEGNREVGKGRMEITEVAPPSKIAIQLDFLEPFEAHNVAEFDLKPQGAATEVTWSMHGRNNYMAKVMCIFVNMDKLVGKDFEAGLANLKAAAEK